MSYLCGVSQTKGTYINISKSGFIISIRLCYIHKDISCSLPLLATLRYGL
nr:MAG TPA: hypothetical protein [Caudoviricetes sp.]